MSKAVMISIKPQWCELIAKKQKTIEVRKTRPKIKTPFKCYIYMTKSNLTGDKKVYKDRMAGKIIGEFVCDFINENISYDSEGTRIPASDLKIYANGRPLYGWHISDLVIYDKPKKLYEFNKLCTDLYQYCQGCKHGLVQYPSDVETYEDLAGCCFDIVCLNQLQKPPQSWCYVEVKE